VVSRLLFEPTHKQNYGLKQAVGKNEKKKKRLSSNKIIDTQVFSDDQMSKVKSENELQLAVF
jgi:hypothetical protein